MPDALISSLLRNHLRRIFLMIYRVVGDADAAQNLTQQAFIEVLQCVPFSDGVFYREESARGRMTEAAVKQISNYLSEGLSHADTPSASASRSNRGASSLDSRLPELRSLRLERRLGLDGGLAELTETERLVLVLRDLEGLSTAQIARQLNCSRGTIYARLARARIKFTAYVENRR